MERHRIKVEAYDIEAEMAVLMEIAVGFTFGQVLCLAVLSIACYTPSHLIIFLTHFTL